MTGKNKNIRNAETRTMEFDIQVRSAPDSSEDRVFEGVASSDQVDTYNTFFVPEGVRYTLPVPLIFHHNREHPVGFVEHLEVVGNKVLFRARVAKVEEPSGGLAARCDEAWASVKSKLIRSVSIGFTPLKYTPVENDVLRFDEWQLDELSLVTIPANKEAQINAIRAIKSKEDIKSTPKTIDKPAVHDAIVETRDNSQTHSHGKQKMTLQEQLVALRKSRASRADSIKTLMTKREDATNETMSEEDGTVFDKLSAEVDALDEEIKRLKKAIEIAAGSAEENPVSEEEAAPTRAAKAALVRSTPRASIVGKEVPGATFARYALLFAQAQGVRSEILRLAEHNTQVTGDNRVENYTRAAVTVGTTQTGNWAAKLVNENGTSAAADFVEFLRPQTIIGQLTGLSPMPFYVPCRIQTTGGVANWVGEGKPKPATSQGFDRSILFPNKVAAITGISDELMRYSNPKADLLVRNDLAAALQARLDLTFVLPSAAGVTGISPASITYGAANSASSGNAFANVIADILKIKQHFLSNQLGLAGVTIIMNELTHSALSSMRSDLGVPLFPGLTLEGGMLESMKVIVSQYVPYDSSGAIVIAVREQDVYLGDEGGLQLAISNEATVEMSTNPDGETGAMVNAFQDNVTFIRAERITSWAKRRAQAVFYLTAVNWGA